MPRGDYDIRPSARPAWTGLVQPHDLGQILTDDPHRPHVTDGTPCWCDAASDPPPKPQPADHRRTVRLAQEMATQTDQEDLAVYVTQAEARLVATELASLAKVREAWAVYLATHSNQGTTAADARYALVVELGRILAP